MFKVGHLKNETIEHEKIKFQTECGVHDDRIFLVFWFPRRVFVFWNYFVKVVTLETLEAPKQPPRPTAGIDYNLVGMERNIIYFMMNMNEWSKNN